MVENREGLTAYFYRVEDDEFCFYHQKEFDLFYSSDLEDLAGFMAEYFYGNHDGNENSWPIELVILDGEKGNEIAKFEIELECIPSFVPVRIYAS